MKNMFSFLSAMALVVATSMASFAGYDGTGGSASGRLRSLTPVTGNADQSMSWSSFRLNQNGSGDFDAILEDDDMFNGNSIGAWVATGAYNLTSAGNWGTFSGVIDSDVYTVDPITLAQSRNISISGLFSPGSAFGTQPTTNAVLSLTFTKANSSNGTQISGSWSFATGAFANPVPEPTTMAIFGLGVAGLGLRRFRRK